MLRDAGKQDKAEIYELWKQSYPNQNRNYLNFYFKNIFDGDEPFTTEFNIEDPILYERILHNHFILHKENKIQLSITRLSNLTEKLEREKIPFIFPPLFLLFQFYLCALL